VTAAAVLGTIGLGFIVSTLIGAIVGLGHR
jgi:hypothetical protein